MKYLKRFVAFEALEINVTDEPEKKLAKELVNDVEKHLKEFPAIKSAIDAAFAQFKDNPDINKKIEDIASEHTDNPLVKGYASAVALRAKTQKMQIDMSKYNNDLYIHGEDLKGLVKSGVKQSYIDAKNGVIADIKTKQAAKKAELDALKKEVDAAFKKSSETIAKMKKDSSENLAKVQK